MPAVTRPVREPNWPVLPDDAPIIYEDEEVGEMGQVNLHALTNEILHICLSYFLKERHPHLCVFTDMNCYYKKGPERNGSLPYVSPDNMIVEPFEPLPEDTRTYTIGLDGPEPRVMIETLSEGTAEDNDLDIKVTLYALLKVPEYILVDVTGEIMPEKLLLKRLQADGTWRDEQDSDGGVTSSLGFRLLIDDAGQLVVVDNATGRRYIRPQEAEEVNRASQEKAEEEARARRLAERKAREAEKKAREEAEARKIADKKAQEEAEARKVADRKAQEEAEARRVADKKAQEETEARRVADRKAQEETEARKIADRKAQEETEARRLAEERLRALQAELELLRAKRDDLRQDH